MSERLRIYNEAVSGQPGTLMLGMVSGVSVGASAYGESAEPIDKTAAAAMLASSTPTLDNLDSPIRIIR
jgi:hypothetical protein